MSTPSSSGLPRSPAALASAGALVVVGDRGGWLLFWPWPAAPGPVVRAHGDGGPVAAVGGDIASSGGWDTAVRRWDPTTRAPRFTVYPFDGRVIALCGQGDDLLVAGADRGLDDRPASDRVTLRPGRVVRLDAAGSVAGEALTATGQIEAMACGTDWVALIDGGEGGRVVWARGRERGALPTDGPATALAATPTALLIADRAGVWEVEPGRGNRRLIAPTGDDHPRVLRLLAFAGRVFGATGESLIAWPGGARVTRDRAQPVALAAHGDSLLALWEDGTLEQRDPRTLAVIRAAPVPREP
jgi:hypothetical protein